MKYEAHRRYGTKEYRAWADMKQRCYNPNNKGYINYGGRGITVCAQWLTSFMAFYEDLGSCGLHLSLDRINNDGNYEPSNCRWTTRVQQRANQRSPINATSHGKSGMYCKGCRCELCRDYWRIKSLKSYHKLRLDKEE